MSEYSDDKFEDGGSSNAADVYKLKLSVDLLSVKSFKMSANIILKYTLNLQAAAQGNNNNNLAYHSFTSKEATPLSAGS